MEHEIKMPVDLEKHFRDKYTLINDNFGYHNTDLYIMGFNDDMTNDIFDEISEFGSISHKMAFSNIPDQLWYGKRFVDIPFGRMDQVFAEKRRIHDENELIGDFIKHLMDENHVLFHQQEIAGSPTMEVLTLTDIMRMKVKFVENNK